MANALHPPFILAAALGQTANQGLPSLTQGTVTMIVPPFAREAVRFFFLTLHLIPVCHLIFFIASSFYKTLICQHETVTLYCPAGEVMKIIGADYGRTNTDECRNGRFGENSPVFDNIACELDVTDILGTM